VNPFSRERGVRALLKSHSHTHAKEIAGSEHFSRHEGGEMRDG
jgi:hypothetical protein